MPCTASSIAVQTNSVHVLAQDAWPRRLPALITQIAVSLKRLRLLLRLLVSPAQKATHHLHQRCRAGGPTVLLRIGKLGTSVDQLEYYEQQGVAELSHRRLEIQERAVELTGVAASSLSRERLPGIALATRKAKEYGVDGGRWQQEARAQAAEHWYGQRELERLRASAPRVASPSESAVVRSAFGWLSGPEGLWRSSPSTR